MKVTRDVIYDLLPGYFAGEISPDTRSLVDEFLEQDPEFSKMMARFRTVFRDPQPAASARATGGGNPGERDEKAIFERARAYLHKRSELRGYVIGFGLAMLFVLIIALRAQGSAIPFLAIAAAFGLTAFISGLQLFLQKSE
jgi:anti-sigma factor RsiW